MGVKVHPEPDHRSPHHFERKDIMPEATTNTDSTFPEEFAKRDFENREEGDFLAFFISKLKPNKNGDILWRYNQLDLDAPEGLYSYKGHLIYIRKREVGIPGLHWIAYIHSSHSPCVVSLTFKGIIQEIEKKFE
jgi:hypothetical protein